MGHLPPEIVPSTLKRQARHYYWYLTNEGIQYLRDYLHLPPELLLLPVLAVTRERVTELLTEELQALGRLTRPELLVLDLHPWSSEEGLAGASLLSNYLSALNILRSE